MKEKIYILILLTTLFFVSCDDKLREGSQVDCYFQYEYVNYAWGFNHSGFTITPAGEVFSFDKSTPWVFADNDKLTLTALTKNIEASMKIDTLINKTDIELYQQLAHYAMFGKLSEPVSRGADMGERICKIIIPDVVIPQNGYSEVILTENGDFDRFNLSPEAVLIATWLIQVQKDL